MGDSKINILIVDDNKQFCDILNEYLLGQKDIAVVGIGGKQRAAAVDGTGGMVIVDLALCGDAEIRSDLAEIGLQVDLQCRRCRERNADVSKIALQLVRTGPQ